MVTSVNKYQDPYRAYNFVVEIEGLQIGGFSEVTGLSSEIELESYQEGGVNDRTHKFPKQTTYPNMVLSHGLTDNEELWQWYQLASQGIIKIKNGTITLRDSQGKEVMWWNFKQAYPVKWEGPQFNASSDEIAIERIELVHQGIFKN